MIEQVVMHNTINQHDLQFTEEPDNQLEPHCRRAIYDAKTTNTLALHHKNAYLSHLRHDLEILCQCHDSQSLFGSL